MGPQDTGQKVTAQGQGHERDLSTEAYCVVQLLDAIEADAANQSEQVEVSR